MLKLLVKKQIAEVFRRDKCPSAQRLAHGRAVYRHAVADEHQPSVCGQGR